MTRRVAAVAAYSAIFLFWFTMAMAAWPQAGTGEVHGIVTDQSGALIPSATIVLSGPQGTTKTVTGGHDGAFRIIGIVPGTYQLAVSAAGFAPLTVQNIAVAAQRSLLQNVTLELPVEQQQVEVTEEAVGVSTVAEDNASSITIKGKDLNALSDDPDELQSELTALAGPAAGPNGAQIFIDGFTGGTLPPKSSIREIRVNQNPFSAQYDKLGYGRIEILTKPGTDKLHGNMMVAGNDNVFNSLNPFVTSEPPYHTLFAMGSVGGSMGARASWFGSVFRRDNAANSIVNAELLDSNSNVYNYSAAVANPQSRTDISPRFDFQLGEKNTLTVRYSFDRQVQTNSGVSGFSLQSQAYNQTAYTNTVQISDSQVLSPNTVNETRFQYMRSTSNQSPLGTDPSIIVQGAFNSGGNSLGSVLDHTDNYELDNYTTVAAKAHAIQYGGRLRYTRDANQATSGFNGTYIYSSLAAYEAQTPSEYTVTAGNANALVSMFDVGAFYQDDYKFNSNLTLSYGVRYEAQNRIGDHNDWAPRMSMAWAPGGSKTKTVIRAGYGWFFDRFNSSNILTSIRNNGVNQQQYVIENPSFYQNAPSASVLATMSATVAPTIYQIAPGLHASINMQAAAGVEHQFGKIATVSATYINSRGVHQYLSDNVNAFLPGSYDLATGAGTRPNGINENIYQFQSGGIYKQNQLMVNYSVQAKRVSLFGFYALTFADADTSGATYFPSDQFDPSADYGPAGFAVRNRLMFGGNLTGPYGIAFSPMFEATSGTPFNITIGQDLNGDNQYNDRPAYATSSSTDVMTTKYGAFDLNPAWNAARIPYDLGTGPGQIGLNMRVSKSFGIGPRVEGGTPQGGGFGGPGGPGGPGGGGPPPGGGGGMPGGGLGPGGLSGSGGGMFKGNNQTVPRKYSLTFTAMGRNILNKVNLAPPVSVLESPLFGISNALASGPFGSSSSSRSIDLEMMFNF